MCRVGVRHWDMLDTGTCFRWEVSVLQTVCMSFMGFVRWEIECDLEVNCDGHDKVSDVYLLSNDLACIVV